MISTCWILHVYHGKEVLAFDGCTTNHTGQWRCGNKCISENQTCHCGTESDNMTKFNLSSGLWCCKQTIAECKTENFDTYCIGNAIKLTQQCHSPKSSSMQCNYNPWDRFRNLPDYTLTRSFFDICDDNITCVDEMDACKGVPRCRNMNDLRWCKNTTSWNEPTNWTSIYAHSVCNLTPQPDGMASHGQVIITNQKDDGEYNCLNRVDESPYSNQETKYDNETKDGVDWLLWANTPCPDDTYGSPQRRCLGRHPEKCVPLFHWGIPWETYGCKDKSDIRQNMTITDTSNFTCGDIYTGHPYYTQKVDWVWFPCVKTKKCIHIDSRCDLHPNTECIYEKNGLMVAEDEEGCFDEYKRKGLIANSANFVCQSPFHNTQMPAILSKLGRWVLFYFNGHHHESGHSGHWGSRNDFNATVIPKGTKVEIQATRCNGVPECWNNEDEKGCGIGLLETILTVTASFLLLIFVSNIFRAFFVKILKMYDINNQSEDILPDRSNSINIKTLLRNEKKSEIKKLINSENTNLGSALRIMNVKSYKEKDLLERREMNKFFIRCLMEISRRPFIWLKQHVDYETCETIISDWS